MAKENPWKGLSKDEIAERMKGIRPKGTRNVPDYSVTYSGMDPDDYLDGKKSMGRRRNRRRGTARRVRGHMRDRSS